MAENEPKNQTPMLGRKIFFVNPPLNIETYVIEGLREQQYEAYTIHEFRKAKAIFRRNPNSMCFIYIDDVMTYNEWYNFIKSFESDYILKTILIGLISSNIKENEKKQFLANTPLPGGFIMHTVTLDNLYEQFGKILEINGAKGCRQYIRLECSKIPQICGYLASGTMLFTFDIINISAVGFCISAPLSMMNIFVKKSLLRNVSLSMGKRTVIVETVVLDTKAENGKCISVLIFKNPPSMLKLQINNFIFDVLEEKHRAEVEAASIDKIDYATLKFSKEDENAKAQLDLNAEDAEEV